MEGARERTWRIRNGRGRIAKRVVGEREGEGRPFHAIRSRRTTYERE